MFNEDWKTAFLSREGWCDATETRVGEDWSLRRFARLSLNGQTAILLQSVPDDDPRAMRGHRLGEYIEISNYLENLGFNVPKIYAENISQGLLLIEDFGDRSLHDLFDENAPDLKSWYLKATDILIDLYKKTPSNDLDLASYYEGHIHPARRFMMDYYWPHITGQSVDEGLAQAYLKIWDEIEKYLPTIPSRFLYIDFHPQNLMIDGDQLGLIDFQGAYWGPVPYDLVNLLEDARRIVPRDIKQACLQKYLDSIPENERKAFEEWYIVLSAQFHCRVIGQAIKLTQNGKPRLMDYVPILQKHLAADLKSPILKPLKDFLAGIGINF